jgi:hypothetical protein
LSLPRVNQRVGMTVRRSMLKFHLLLAVWGDQYIDTLVRLTVPTLLYEGNLPSLAQRHQCKMVFFVRESEETKLKEAASVCRLASVVPVEFVHFDPDSALNVYLAMSDAHHRGCLAAREAGAKVITLSPDGLFADGSLSKVGDYAEQGKIAVMCSGLRILYETAAPALASRVASGAIAPRELVSLTLRYLHPEARRYFVSSLNFSTFPTICCWELGPQKGLLVRCFHLHPLMVDVTRIGSLDALKEESIDGTLLGSSLTEWSDVYVETDSDNIHVCTLTPANAFYSESLFRPFCVDDLRAMAYGPMVNGLHRHFFKQALKLHVDDLDESWNAAEASTQWIADAVQERPSRFFYAVRRVGRSARRMRNRILRTTELP